MTEYRADASAVILWMMSKLRQQIDLSIVDAPIAAEPLGDLKPYVIFTQLKENGPHIYAGWLEAVDDEMAMSLSKEHYGRDQECVGIWAIDRSDLHSSDGLYAITDPPGPCAYAVFTQKRAGDVFLEAGSIDADSPQQAVEFARAKPQAAKAHCVWVAPVDRIVASEAGELIWRHTDQTYRLARGYTRAVKEKWKQFRTDVAMKEYEKDDLKEEF